MIQRLVFRYLVRVRSSISDFFICLLVYSKALGCCWSRAIWCVCARDGLCTMPITDRSRDLGTMTRVYYKYAIAAVIVFDVTRPATFEAVLKVGYARTCASVPLLSADQEQWREDINSKVVLANDEPIPCLLLANKVHAPASTGSTHLLNLRVCSAICPMPVLMRRLWMRSLSSTNSSFGNEHRHKMTSELVGLTLSPPLLPSHFSPSNFSLTDEAMKQLIGKILEVSKENAPEKEVVNTIQFDKQGRASSIQEGGPTAPSSGPSCCS